MSDSAPPLSRAVSLFPPGPPTSTHCTHTHKHARLVSDLTPSSNRPSVSRFPVRVKALFIAPVPAYWRETSSPWSAQATRNARSSCRKGGRGGGQRLRNEGGGQPGGARSSCDGQESAGRLPETGAIGGAHASARAYERVLEWVWVLACFLGVLSSSTHLGEGGRQRVALCQQAQAPQQRLQLAPPQQALHITAWAQRGRPRRRRRRSAASRASGPSQ